MIINDVHQGINKHKKRKRVGRGRGSGHGKTCGRGHKGQFSRAGASNRRGYEGGQMPLVRRIAKRGFSNRRFETKVAIINLSTLEASFDAGTEVTPQLLVESGLVKGKFDVIKILGNGELTKALDVTAHAFSASAEQKIQAGGGTVRRITLDERTENEEQEN